MSNPGLELSEAIASVVERLGPSVVRVEGRPRMPSTGIVWSADGVIVTAQHTVEREEHLEVGLPDGSKAEAKLVGRDPTTDLAVLKLEASGLVPAPFGDTSGLKVGHLVVALGRPGRSTRATIGILSALGDSEGFRTPHGGRIERYVEPDLGLTPGFNGGLLADLSGRVIGLNSAAILRGATVTVPTATLKRVTEKLLEHGRMQRAYLGVGTYPVQLPQKLAAAAGQEGGLLVISVQPEGPADQAGFMLGDVLTALDGQALEELAELMDVLNEERIGKAVTAKVWRGGQPVELSITPAARGR